MKEYIDEEHNNKYFKELFKSATQGYELSMRWLVCCVQVRQNYVVYI